MKQKANEYVSGGTHLLGAVLILAGTIILVANSETALQIFSFIVFGVLTFIGYLASTIYHFFKKPDKTIYPLRKLDHAGIYLIIAGTFTPFCLVLLHNLLGWIVLGLVWILAIAGISTIFLDSFWKAFPRWASTGLYVVMGWIGLVFIYPLRIYPEILFWIFLGGVFYTIGAIIYVLKKPNMSNAFGFHELFHIFILLGTACHFWCMLNYLT